MDGVTFRPARIDELDRLSDIVNDPPNAATLRIAGSLEKAIAGGRVLARRGLSLQLQHTTVAELNGETIGLMDASAQRTDPSVGALLVLRLLVPVIQVIGFGGLWRLLRSRPAWARVGFEPPVGAYYHIAELDIDARFRNRGIGAAFLLIAEQQAREQGCERISLSTDIVNPAQRLYDRVGFRIVETKRDAAYERWSSSPGRVLMVKELR
jgi:ribosomal protein S18 acetylase RimI-like enzyme